MACAVKNYLFPKMTSFSSGYFTVSICTVSLEHLRSIKLQEAGIYFASLVVLGTQWYLNKKTCILRKVCIIFLRQLHPSLWVFYRQDVELQGHLNVKRSQFHQPLVLWIFRKSLLPSYSYQVAKRYLWSTCLECKLLC